MFTRTDLHEIVDLMNHQRIPYLITGGIALDVVRRRFTRQHDDLNLLVEQTEQARVLALTRECGYEWAAAGKLLNATRGESEIELWPFTVEADAFVVRGNKATRYYPKALLFGQYIAFSDRRIHIASPEQLRFDTERKESKVFPADWQLVNSFDVRDHLYARIRDAANPESTRPRLHNIPL